MHWVGETAQQNTLPPAQRKRANQIPLHMFNISRSPPARRYDTVVASWLCFVPANGFSFLQQLMRNMSFLVDSNAIYAEEVSVLETVTCSAEVKLVLIKRV